MNKETQLEASSLIQEKEARLIKLTEAYCITEPNFFSDKDSMKRAQLITALTDPTHRMIIGYVLTADGEVRMVDLMQNLFQPRILPSLRLQAFAYSIYPKLLSPNLFSFSPIGRYKKSKIKVLIKPPDPFSKVSAYQTIKEWESIK